MHTNSEWFREGDCTELESQQTSCPMQLLPLSSDPLLFLNLRHASPSCISPSGSTLQFPPQITYCLSTAQEQGSSIAVLFFSNAMANKNSSEASFLCNAVTTFQNAYYCMDFSLQACNYPYSKATYFFLARGFRDLSYHFAHALLMLILRFTSAQILLFLLAPKKENQMIRRKQFCLDC